ncbi:MAG: SPOR domain-containing protein [Deltaproteobacteria bacterium]
MTHFGIQASPGYIAKTRANALKQFAILDATLILNLFPKWLNVVRKKAFFKELKCYKEFYLIMSRKTSKPKKKGSVKGGLGFELTRKEVVLWLGVAFLVLVWMFTLGVIVGRGLSPVRFDVEKLTNELAALKEQALKREKQGRHGEAASPRTPLGFYDALTDKKEEARLRSKTKEASSRSRAQLEPPVKVESKTQRKVFAKPQPSSDKEGPAAGPLTLQVASLKDPAKAQEMVSDLKSKGYSAYQVTTEVPGKGTYHRVRVGHFKDRSAARQAVVGLRQEKLEPFIIQE